MALKLGRDEVRWARSPCSPGREGWNATAWRNQVNIPWRQKVSPTEGIALHGSVCSDNSPEWLALWTIRRGMGVLGFSLRLSGKIRAKYEDLECQA